MALTAEQIQAAEDNEEVIELLVDELQRLLPDDAQEDRDRFHKTLANLPRGLRAMAGMHFFDVSMSLDDLAWHFANQNEERDLQETLNGLRELEITEVADLFEKAVAVMEPFLDTLRRGEVAGEEFYDWLRLIGVEEKIEPMNEIIWAYRENCGELGLLETWAVYAKKYPERCVVPSLFKFIEEWE
jgi:hypothetical protein